MNQKIENFYKTLSQDFFGFWVRRRRITLLFAVVLVALGMYALFTIPKESSPKIEFGIIGINTIYLWASPEDIDQLITAKIEKKILDIKGVSKVESSSSLSVSNITVTLENEADTNQVLTDIKDEIDKTVLPTDVEDPIVTEISTDTKQMFDILVYAPENRISEWELKQKAEKIKALLEGKNKISTIVIDWSSDYDIQILVDKSKVESIKLGLASLAQAIRGFVTRVPLGNYTIDETNYDYRITKSVDKEEDLWKIIIPSNAGAIRLADIATIQKKYKDERVLKMGKYQEKGYKYVRLTFNKKQGANIFTSSEAAKSAIEELMKTEEFSWLQYSYVQDIASFIQDDYKSLAKNWLTTMILVFVAVLLFVWLKEGIIATLSIPLAFFVTFIVLKQMWLSLNFLTNFSLIVTFGIAIDTIIVIIEAAAEKIKLWHEATSAVLLAVRDYKRPLISWTATTVVVFIPLFTLPWVTGKFLAYIPITIFITLVAALFISLTLNPVFYYLSSKRKNYYVKDREEEEFLEDDEKELLLLEREWKEEKEASESSLRHRTIDKLCDLYHDFLEKFLVNKKRRRRAIVAPIIILIVSFPLLAPQIGFKLFPSGDNPYLFVDVKSPVWSSKTVLQKYESQVDDALSSIPEVKEFYYSIKDNLLSASIELRTKEERASRGMRDSFAVEEEINEKLSSLKQYGLSVESKVESWGPPVGKAVGIKLVAGSIDQFEELKRVSGDFEAFLKSQSHTKNTANSSKSTPWQFVFDFDKAALEVLGLTPGQVIPEVVAAINGINAWSLPWRFDDYDIRVLYKEFISDLTPQDVDNLLITTPIGQVRLWDITNYNFATNINAISRENGDIVIKVEADLENNLPPTSTQAALASFAESYPFPQGISYQMGWENNENSDLIISMGVSFIIAVLLIYSILVFQFNSFKQPAFIMYTVLMAMLWANIGLFITGNPYSMAFGIGFIALTGIVVNDAIVLIDRINRNKTRGMDTYAAIVEAGKSRLQPIILTTITTILGLMSIVRQDEFFAWLAYTIMFGLFVWSLMTLFVIPAIYYQFVKDAASK